MLIIARHENGSGRRGFLYLYSKMPFIHEQLRPHQESTYNCIRGSKAKFIVIRAPTGAGKSFFPAQLVADGHKVITLTRTKSLQAQYQRSYDFTVLFGKGNYECLEYGVVQDEFFSGNGNCATADLCTVSKSHRENCQYNCPYYLARADFLDSPGGSLNYTKFLMDYPIVQAFNPEYLFLDESHELSDLVTDFSGFSRMWKSKAMTEYADRVWINFPNHYPAPIAHQAVAEGEEWLNQLLGNITACKPEHPNKGGDRRKYKRWGRLKEKVEVTLASLAFEPECWFVRADKEKFVCKPLTSKFHFRSLFDKAPKIVLMSATISHTDIKALGIDDYEFIDVPNIWPAPLRPIKNLPVPRLSHKSTDEEWQAHAEIIADVINVRPDYHTGIIHSPSKWLTWDLAERLQSLTHRPIYVPDESDGTEEVARKWLEVQDNGTIGVFWQLWEGYDGGKDDICIVAKTPFVNFAEPFDFARFEYDKVAGLTRVANKLVQGLGRIRRGHSDHYGSSKLVAIADGNWKRIKNYIGKDILDAIQ